MSFYAQQKISINELKSLHVVQNDKKRFGKEC